MSMISNNVLSLVNKCVLNPHKSNLKNIDLRGNCRSFFFTFFIYNFIIYLLIFKNTTCVKITELKNINMHTRNATIL